MEQTNEKKNKKSTSLFSKLISPEKKAAKKEEKIPKKDVSKQEVNSNQTPSNDSSAELDSIIKVNKNAKPVEYYDLPYRYNQTVIKILAQTPHSIFIYWDISDEDRQQLEEKYGQNFFNETKPVLLVHNQTQNYSFEVEIDDFTNSWYLRTPTSNCKFNIELGRKVMPSNTNIKFETADNLLHISSSNIIESPNDHVLKESLLGPVFFKNIKTNELEERKVTNLASLKNLYKDFNFNDEFIHNPSSSFKI